MLRGFFKIVGACAFLLVCKTDINAQLNVVADQTAQQLAAKIAGAGVEVRNAVLNCPSIANGIFTVTSSNLGIDSGIVLTTGRVATQNSNWGVNTREGNLASTRNNAPGDAALTVLAGQTTYDACKLEFDFVPSGDSVSFDYIFGSEEYINATCGNYNDAFAFFISGPGIAGEVNMALVPNTNIPVTINSINSGVPGPGFTLSNCQSMGPGSPFVNYFINNTNGTSIAYKGFTKVLKATHAVQPCSTYHLKLVIADAGNYLYDSGVFIKANSLSVPKLDVATITHSTDTPYVVRGCSAGSFRISVSHERANNMTVNYALGGDAINGVDYQALNGSTVLTGHSNAVDIPIIPLSTASGEKKIIIYIYSPFNCSGTPVIEDSAYCIIKDAPQMQIITPDTALCNQNNFRLQVQGDDFLTYTWSPSEGLSDSTVKEPYVNLQKSTTYVLHAEWPGSGCPTLKDSVTILSKVPSPPYVSSPLHFCKGQQGIDTLSVDGNNIVWHLSQNSTDSLGAPKINTQQMGTTKYYVSKNAYGCESERSEIIVVIETCCDDEIFIPTAFSPNNDGRNDVFKIKSNSSQLIGYLYIMNRWGQTLFKGEGNMSWDGTFNGSPAEAGVYYYVAEIRCKNANFFQKKGDVTLIR